MNGAVLYMKFSYICRTSAFSPVNRLLLTMLLLAMRGAAAGGEVMDVQYASRCYTTSDGLPGMMVECVRQDGDGFIWVAGTSFIARFDGFGFRSYTEGRTPNIGVLTTDLKGRIAAFSNKYIYTLDSRADTVRRTPIPEGYQITDRSSTALPPGYGIFYRKQPRGQALFAIHGDTITEAAHHPDLDALGDEHKAWYDPASKSLYLPLPEGVSVLRGGERVAFHEGLLARAFVWYSDALWAIAQDGFYRLDGDRFVLTTPYQIDRQTGFVTARVDAHGDLLFKDFNTLYRYRDGRVERIFTANAIRDFIVDTEGNIWVATYQGLYNLFRLNFRNYRLADPGDVVRSAVWDPVGKRVLAGSLNGTLVGIDENGAHELRYPDNPYGAAFFDVYPAAADGAVYLPGPGDVLEVRGGHARWMGLPLHDPYASVTPMSGEPMSSQSHAA